MTRKILEGEAAASRRPNPGVKRDSADIMLAPLRTVRKLHAMAVPPDAKSRPGELSLTSAQMRIWVFSQLNPDLPIFNTFRAYKIAGPLRLDLLTRCLNEIAARHEVLRTTYPEIDGIPRPVIGSNANIRLEVSDSVDLLANGSEDEVTDYCNKRISLPIELTSGPIFRAEAIKADEDEHILIMVSHQIIFDGASWSILNREFTRLYESYCSNSPPSLNEMPLQFVDFARWQSEFLQAEPLDVLSSYWRQQLGGSLPILGLPTQNSSQALTYNEGHSLPFTIPENLTKSLKELSKREGVTLFVVLLSAFNLLLRQFSDQSDLIVFTSVPCRTRSEFRHVIGLFSNFIPLRTNLAENSKFTDLLIDVQKIYSGALGHQDLPFEYIVKELQAGQGVINESLIQTLFVFENAAKKTLSFTQCKSTPLNLKTGFTKFDITLFMEEKEGGMTGSLRYKPAKYKAAMIELMVSRFITVLEALVSQPEQPVDDIHCLTPSERNDLLKARSSEGRENVSEDRKATATSRVVPQALHRMPGTQMESLVATVWEDVLGVHNIGTRDNFFDLGGNSQLLIMLIGRLQKKLQLNISIIEIFRDPTISSFVKRLEDLGSDGSTYDHIHERAAKKRRASINRRKIRSRQG